MLEACIGHDRALSDKGVMGPGATRESWVQGVAMLA